MNVYVGSLPWDLTEEELRKEFEAFGEVVSAKIIKDKFTNRSRGFGFVEMSNKEDAEAAISGLNGKDIKGRTVKVSEARQRSDSRDRFRDKF